MSTSFVQFILPALHQMRHLQHDNKEAQLVNTLVDSSFFASRQLPDHGLSSGENVTYK